MNDKRKSDEKMTHQNGQGSGLKGRANDQMERMAFHCFHIPCAVGKVGNEGRRRGEWRVAHAGSAHLHDVNVRTACMMMSGDAIVTREGGGQTGYERVQSANATNIMARSNVQ